MDTKEDLEHHHALRLLNREPKTSFQVVASCAYGYPQVLQNEPVDFEGHPFPTLFWLICPFLYKEIGRLEGGGMINDIRRWLKSDPGFREEFISAGREYRQFKSEEIKKSDPEEKPLYIKLRKAGIDGALGEDSIKCLHAHYAYFLAGYADPVGEAVRLELGEKDCGNECEGLEGEKEDE